METMKRNGICLVLGALFLSSCTSIGVSTKIVEVEGGIDRSVFKKGCSLDLRNGEETIVYDSRNLRAHTARDTLHYNESFTLSPRKNYVFVLVCGSRDISKEEFYSSPFKRVSKVNMGLVIEIMN